MMEWVGQVLALVIMIGGAFAVGVECGSSLKK